MTLRLGLVGHGRWGRNIQRTLLAFTDVSVAVIARGEKPPARLDGVLIATPSATHVDVALPYIEAGVATFIEKPMATSLSAAERLREAAKRSGAVVFVGHIFLYHPAFLSALKSLPSLGAVRYLLCEGMNDNPRKDSSVLWDWLPHDLSIARAIFDREPESAASWKLAGEEQPTAAICRFEFNSIPVISTVSWLSLVRRRRVTIACEDAMIVLDDNTERRLALHRRDMEPVYPAYSSELPLTLEMAAFLDAVRSNSPDDTHVQTGLSIVRAITAAENSIALGGQQVAI